VASDCTVEVDGNAYSVPWRLIGERVRISVTEQTLRVHHGAHEVARHAVASGRRQRVVDPAHYAGVAGAQGRGTAMAPVSEATPAAPPSLLRPLAEYEALIGGGF
jgi:hypothetical protein